MKAKLFLLFSLFLQIGISQTLSTLAVLPPVLIETSGIIISSSNEIWTHNDGGNAPILYKIDTNGNIVDSIIISGVPNIDFEDITKDNLGNVYIGDFGNNSHNRTNLVIHKIPNPDSIIGNTVVPQKIFFHYSDQILFPDTGKNKDCEAMVHFNNQLYLFTKNWGRNGYTKRYKLPDSAGTYTANLLDSFQTGGMVTSADINSNGTLVLLEIGKIHLFQNYSSNNFFNGRYTSFIIPFSQTEAIAFLDSNTFYLTQEHHSFFPDPKLLKLEINLLFENITLKKTKLNTSLYPNPAKDFITVKITGFHKKKKYIKCKLLDSNGRTIKKWKIKSVKNFSVSIFDLPKGKYYIQVKIKKQKAVLPFIKM